MFKTSYRFNIHPTKNIITLRPTLGTYVRALAPLVVFYGAGLVMLHSAEKDLDAIDTDNESPVQ